jgi:hypothetical protein
MKSYEDMKTELREDLRIHRPIATDAAKAVKRLGVAVEQQARAVDKVISELLDAKRTSRLKDLLDVWDAWDDANVEVENATRACLVTEAYRQSYVVLMEQFRHLVARAVIEAEIGATPHSREGDGIPDMLSAITGIDPDELMKLLEERAGQPITPQSGISLERTK